MNPGTFYLYEYENKKRRRNVGFIKISRHFNSCIIQIRTQRIPTGNGADLSLYAFFLDKDHMIGRQISSLRCFSGNISARFSVSETHFPQMKTLSDIDGFLIKSPEQNCGLFWMASEHFLDADPALMRTDDVPSALPNSSPEEKPVPRELQTSDEAEKSVPEISGMASPEKATPPCRVRKITHSEINRLPSRLWPLANNSFLLHGYRTYGHLLIIRENGKYWLGVPGIFDSQEARVAELYGFPRFTRSYTGPAGLSEDERNDQADFGHWCRCTGPCVQESDS